MKPAQIAQFAFIIAAALAVFTFVTAAQDGEARASCSALCAVRPAYANQDRTAPDFELPDLDGKPVKLSSYRGQTVVVNFWTKTCRPCLEEMPSLAEFAKLLHDIPGVTLLTVSTGTDAQDARATMKAVLGQDPAFPVLVDPEANIVDGLFGTRLYPETWIIDARGVIRLRIDGARDWSSPLLLDVVRMVQKPVGACPIVFDAGHPRGPRHELCDDVAMGPR